MLKCIAIDDEPLALRQIAAYIDRIPYLELAATFSGAAEALDFLGREPVDLAFIDINMPDMNGVEFVRAMERRPMIIFTTAYAEYALEGFKLDAIDYLLKPFSFDEFSHSASKAHSIWELLRHSRLPAAERATDEAEAEPRDNEYLTVKAGYKVSLIQIAEIVYLESAGEYVRIHLTDGTTVTTLFRLKNMETALPADAFVRVHRSYIVHLRCIKSYDRARIYLSDTDYLPIGENYREAFLDLVGRISTAG